MKNVVLKYGLIAGLIQMVIGLGLLSLWKNSGELNIQLGEILGYATMIVSLSFIFFGIKAYRDQKAEGVISFGKAFKVGLLITLIASAIYVASWMVYYHSGGGQEMMDAYLTQTINDLRSSGQSEAVIEQEVEKMKAFMASYEQQPLVMIGVSFMEIFPVGLIISLIAAALLKKKPEAIAAT